MSTRRRFLVLGGTAAGAVLVGAAARHWPSTGAPGLVAAAEAAPAAEPTVERFEVVLTDAEWRARLSPASYAVLRHEATERPYSSPLNDEHRRGTFACAGCALPLFSSSTKFDSGTGWPSFWQPLAGAVVERTDRTLGMARTEVHCRRCGGHLGHVFDDGPRPTGLRYCMNGVSMSFAGST
ncbi:peptide-methionine (R)-S-oxide reductase MsrB [Roseateles chitinivorans]|uniref:peptide-methionine (R)-S-oxide reductase MsrB n=1 Tax=Roseateles chitinivorans TaxID=2917965 RepID=UPI003D67CDC2